MAHSSGGLIGTACPYLSTLHATKVINCLYLIYYIFPEKILEKTHAFARVSSSHARIPCGNLVCRSVAPIPCRIILIEIQKLEAAAQIYPLGRTVQTQRNG
jgi:hypothetical protein